MKIFKRIISLEEKTFGDNVSVFINYTKEELSKYIEKKTGQPVDTEIEPGDSGMYINVFNQITGQSIPIIWLKKYGNTTSGESVFLHELAHFVFASLTNRGIIIKGDDVGHQEIFCYMFDFFYEQWRAKISKIYEGSNRNRSMTEGRNNIAKELKNKTSKAHSSHKGKGLKKNKK